MYSKDPKYLIQDMSACAKTTCGMTWNHLCDGLHRRLCTDIILSIQWVPFVCTFVCRYKGIITSPLQSSTVQLLCESKSKLDLNIMCFEVAYLQPLVRGFVKAWWRQFLSPAHICSSIIKTWWYEYNECNLVDLTDVGKPQSFSCIQSKVYGSEI